MLDGKQVEVKSCFAKQKNRGWRSGQPNGNDRAMASDGSGKGRKNDRGADNSGFNGINDYGSAEGYTAGYGAGYGIGNYGAGYGPGNYLASPYAAAATNPGYLGSPYEQYKASSYMVGHRMDESPSSFH